MNSTPLVKRLWETTYDWDLDSLWAKYDKDAFNINVEDTRTRLTPEERRERNRLRSLRWRRAHGIGPRRPAGRPWLALGISRTFYRHCDKSL
jgi:hypothetical protein